MPRNPDTPGRWPTARMRLTADQAELAARWHDYTAREIRRATSGGRDGRGTARADAIHDAHIDILLGAARAYDPDRGVKFYTLLRRSQHFAARNAGRGCRRTLPTVPLSEDHPVPSPAPPPDPTEGSLAELLGPLDERSRFLLDAEFRRGLAVPEIARSLGLSPGYTYRLRGRALARLRRLFADREASCCCSKGSRNSG